MADIGTLSGLTGLAKTVKTAETANQELGVLQNLKNNIDKDQKESLAFQELEAQEYEAISKEASSLLERDRSKINTKSLMLQSKIQEGIKQFGSREKFFQNGGLAQLKKYKSDLLYSDEFTGYKDNQKNLTAIMQLQASGKGHLIAPKDLKAMQEYQNGIGDKISYSGLMTEVDFGIESLYPLGVDVPDIAILKYKDNFSRIYGNYVTENGPDSLAGLGEAEIQTELMNFMQKMRYGTKGKDEFYRNEAAMQARARQQYRQEAAAKAGTPEEPEMRFTTEVGNALNDMLYENGVSIQELAQVDPKTGQPVNYLTSKGNQNLRNLGMGDNTSAWRNAYKQSTTKSGDYFSAFSNFFSSKRFQPASAIKLPLNGDNLLKVSGFGKPNEDGTVNYKLDTSLYNATGQMLAPDEVDSYMLSGAAHTSELEGKAKVLGAFMGFKTGDGKLLTQVVDKNGKVIKKENDAHMKDGYGDSNYKHSMFVAFETENGDVFYKDIGGSDLVTGTEINIAMGEYNNLTKENKAKNTSKKYSDNARASILKDQKLIKEQVNTASSLPDAFGSAQFTYEADAYTSSDGNNRTKELKAYYMAYDAMTNGTGAFGAKTIANSGEAKNSRFTYTLNQGSLKNDIFDHSKYGGKSFIDHYITVQNEDLVDDAESAQENLQFGNLWKAYFDILNDNKK